MKWHFIRHGMTEANEKKWYCGCTDLELSQRGIAQLEILKREVSYPDAELFLTSGVRRTAQTLKLLYGNRDYHQLSEWKEMNFGDFEMKSYEQLRKDPAYCGWAANFETQPCPGGESRAEFLVRVENGIKKAEKICAAHSAESAVIIVHGGVIAEIMGMFFPGERNFYEWQPACGRGYTIHWEFKEYSNL